MIRRKKKVLGTIAVVLMALLAMVYIVSISLAQPASGQLQGVAIHGRVVSIYGPVENAR